ncbi:hypothetical protein DPEC_G00320220 [Dallia pectoralis]|uniref:Uncharacterized protein n=1 Tax=Dallia pectoralis TaxID=75939 RepID=A0ACC2F9W2_DALPE|nr:hypothetical protein DPEC_G00320220 [Dallia pectoralis]
MSTQPGPQPRVLFQTSSGQEEEPPQRRLGKLTVKYNRKDLQRRLDVEEWIDGQLHLLFDCEEDDIPELGIDIDILVDLSDAEQRSKLHDLLRECNKPKEDFIDGLLYREKKKNDSHGSAVPLTNQSGVEENIKVCVMAQFMAERETFRSLTEGRVVTGRPPVHQEGYSRLIQQQRQAFESEVRMYSGDDPLDVWDRYLKWTLQTFPHGGKESGLKDILERAVQQLSGDNKNYNDPRYVGLWIKLAQNSSDPLEIFSYMQTQRIGLTQAALYVAWAEELEKQGNIQKADAIFQEGLKCGALPLDKLQQCQKGFRHRVSGQLMSDVVDEAEEDQEPEPARTSMVDLRPRGRKKTSFNNAEASFGATEPMPEPWTVPASITINGNEVMPEMDANVKIPQNLWCPSVTAPPRWKDLQPVPGSATSLPVAACKMDPAVNMVLSARQSQSRNEPGPEPLPAQERPEEGTLKEQSMYPKEQLLNGPVELSIEELRAENYFARKRQEIEETIQRQNQVKDQLKQQIEEKKRLIEMRQLLQQPEQVTSGESVTQSCSSSSVPFIQQSAPPFQIFDEESQSDTTHAAGTAIPRQRAAITDDVFLRPGERVLCFKTPHPLPDGNIPHCKRTLAKNFADKSESLSEDVVNGHENKMLCASPEDTLDFVKAAKMASSSYSSAPGERPLSPDTSALTQDPVVVPQADVTANQRKKLSPIQEASLEVWSTLASTSSYGTSSGGKPAPHLSRCEQSQADPSPREGELMSPSFQSVLEDPCNVSRRLQILELVDLSSVPDFYSDEGPLPLAEEDDVLVLGGTTFALNSKTDFKDFSIYEGWCAGALAVKVERCAVPWDFYIGSQLRERLARDSQGHVHDAGRCFLFRDGCITIHKASQMRTLREVTEGPFEQIVVSVVIQILELVRRMHSCHLIHGALNSDTLVLNSHFDKRLDGADGVVAVDFSCSVDLERQPEVTAAQNLSSGQDFIQQGLLSPTASPYQVDLLGVAETVYTLLMKRCMRPVKVDSEWTLEEYVEADPSNRRDAFWSTFFHSLLNPGERSSVSVLTGLLESMRTSGFAC